MTLGVGGVRGADQTRSPLPVGLTPLSDSHDEDDKVVILNLINDAMRAHSQAVEVHASLKFLNTRVDGGPD